MSASGGACTDSGPTPPASVLTKATGGQPVKVAVIGIGPKGIGSGGNTRAVAERLSRRAPHPGFRSGRGEIDAGLCVKEPRTMRAAMAKYARQWQALDAKTKASISAQVGQTQEGAAAQFEIFTNEGSSATIAAAQFHPCRCLCRSSAKFPPASKALPSEHRPGTGLDAGKLRYL